MEQTYLLNHLLVAMPTVKDPNFEKSVILLCEHAREGSVGIMVNRLMQFPLQLVFDQLKIKPEQELTAKRPLLYGGPLQPERGFVLHRPCGVWQSSTQLMNDAVVTTSNDVIRAIAIEKGPPDALVALGYVGWEENQLEQEVKDNTWLVCPFKPEVLYDVPFGQRWAYAGMLLGVKMYDLMNCQGHA